ncbi:MAG TPA: CatB-related O-acetyltransferase [Azonexus sp.]|nr:CatB-related O-acetyltransferase [Azonexus sp.]
MTSNLPKTFTIGCSPFTIGRFTYGYENISVFQSGEGASLNIGSFCSIAPAVTIFLGGNHRTDWITTFPFGHIFQNELGDEKTPGHPSTNGNVTIGDDVWIGTGASIMSGLTIGCGAVISANAHVVNDVLPYQIVGGNPSRVLRDRFEDEIKDLLIELKWWDLPLADIKQIKHDLCSTPTKELLLNLISRYHY